MILLNQTTTHYKFTVSGSALQQHNNFLSPKPKLWQNQNLIIIIALSLLPKFTLTTPNF